MGKDHIGLKILGVLAILSGLIMIIAGVSMMGVGTEVAEEASDSIFLIPILIPVGFAIAIMGIVYAILGGVVALIGYYLFRERKWAYWLTFVLTILGIIAGLFSSSPLTIAISVAILIYLLYIREDFTGVPDITTV